MKNQQSIGATQQFDEEEYLLKHSSQLNSATTTHRLPSTINQPSGNQNNNNNMAANFLFQKQANSMHKSKETHGSMAYAHTSQNDSQQQTVVAQPANANPPNSQLLKPTYPTTTGGRLSKNMFNSCGRSVHAADSEQSMMTSRQLNINNEHLANLSQGCKNHTTMARDSLQVATNASFQGQYHSSLKKQESRGPLRKVSQHSIIQDSQSHVGVNQGPAPNVCEVLRKEMVDRAEGVLAQRERQYKHMKSTLTNFKDGSLSALGKIGYQLTDIAQQRLNLQKDYLLSMKEHKKAASIEKIISHVDDEAIAAKNRSLSKVTQDKIAMRKQNQLLGGKNNLTRSKEGSFQTNTLRHSKTKIETGHAVIQSNEAFQEELDNFLLAPEQRQIHKVDSIKSASRGFESQKSAPLLKIRIQQAKIQMHQHENQQPATQQHAQQSNDKDQFCRSTLKQKMSSIKSGTSQSQSPVKLNQRLNSNESSNSQFATQFSPEKNKSLLLVHQGIDYIRQKPQAKPPSSQALHSRKMTVDKGSSPLQRDASGGNEFKQKRQLCTINVDGGDGQKDRKQGQQYYTVQRTNKNRAAMTTTGVGTDCIIPTALPDDQQQVITEMTQMKNREKLQLSSIHAKTDLIEKSESRQTATLDPRPGLISPDHLPANFLDDKSSSTISEESASPIQDGATIETMTASIEQKKSEKPSPVGLDLIRMQRPAKFMMASVKEAISGLETSNFDPINRRYHQSSFGSVVEELKKNRSQSPPNQKHSKAISHLPSTATISGLPQTMACKLKMKRDIRDFQLKQKEYRNVRVINQDPAFTNHYNKKRKEHMHNQMRLQLLFGPSNNNQYRLDEKDEKVQAYGAEKLHQERTKSSRSKSKQRYSPNSIYKQLKGGKAPSYNRQQFHRKRKGKKIAASSQTIMKQAKSERHFQSLQANLQTDGHLEYGSYDGDGLPKTRDIASLSPKDTRLDQKSRANKTVTIDIVGVDHKSSTLTSIIEKDNVEGDTKDAMMQRQDNIDFKSFTLKNGPDTFCRNTADNMLETEIKGKASSHTLIPDYYQSANFLGSRSTSSKEDQARKQSDGQIISLDGPTMIRRKKDQQQTPFSWVSQFKKPTKLCSFKTHQERHELTKNRIDTDSGVSNMFKASNKKTVVNYRKDMIIRPLTGHYNSGSTKPPSSRGAKDHEAASKHFGGAGNNSDSIQETRNPSSRINLHQPIVRLDKCATNAQQQEWNAANLRPMVQSYDGGLIGQYGSLNSRTSSEENYSFQADGKRTVPTNSNNNVKLLDIHCASIDQFINIRHENESTILKTTLSSKQFSNEKQLPVLHEHFAQRPLIQLKPSTSRTKSRLSSDKMNHQLLQIGGTSQQPQATTTHTMYNTFKSQKAAIFQKNPYSHSNNGSRPAAAGHQHTNPTTNSAHKQASKVKSAAKNSGPKSDQTSLIILTNMADQKKNRHRSRQERIIYSNKHAGCKIHSHSSERDIYLAKTFPPAEHHKLSIDTLAGVSMTTMNKTGVSFTKKQSAPDRFIVTGAAATNGITAVNSPHNGEIAVQTEGGSHPPSVVNNSPPSKAIFSTQKAMEYGAIQLQNNNNNQDTAVVKTSSPEQLLLMQTNQRDLVVRVDTSLTDSDAGAQGAEHQEEEEQPDHQILTNVIDIVPVKFTPIVSSKNSRSSSCIFKGSHSKIEEKSKQGGALRMSSFDDSRSNTIMNSDLVFQQNEQNKMKILKQKTKQTNATQKDLSTQKSATLQLQHDEYSAVINNTASVTGDSKDPTPQHVESLYSKRQEPEPQQLQPALYSGEKSQLTALNMSLNQTQVPAEQQEHLLLSKTNNVGEPQTNTNFHDQELHGRTMPFDTSFILTQRESIQLRSSRAPASLPPKLLAKGDASNKALQNKLSPSKAPTKVSITVKNDPSPQKLQQTEQQQQHIIVENERQETDLETQEEELRVETSVPDIVQSRERETTERKQIRSQKKVRKQLTRAAQMKSVEQTRSNEMLGATSNTSYRRLYQILQEASMQRSLQRAIAGSKHLYKDQNLNNNHAPFGVAENDRAGVAHENSRNATGNVVDDSSQAYHMGNQILRSSQQTAFGHHSKSQHYGFLQIEGYSKQTKLRELSNSSSQGNAAVYTTKTPLKTANSNIMGKSSATVTFKAGSARKNGPRTLGGIHRILVQGSGMKQ